MKPRILTVLFCAVPLAVLTGCAGLSRDSLSDNADLPKQMAGRQILVTLPDQLKEQWPAIRAELAKKHRLKPSGEFPLSSLRVDCLVFKILDQRNPDSVMEQLRADPRVILVQENQVFEGIQSSENDPLADISYSPRLIHADKVHNLTTGKGIRIAVIDTGAEKDHPDLKDRIQHTDNFVDGGDKTFSQDRHGTAVTGIIGARANNGIGIYGIAPDAKLSVYKACWYPERASAKAKCSSWSLAKALDAAINSGAQIINLSLAGAYDELLNSLLESAHIRGINIVAATLEKQDQPGFPAELAVAIPVISSDPNGQIVKPAWLSDHPKTVAAPGIEILTTVPKNGYDYVSGSSLATAHVSGIIALLLELKPNLTPDQIQELFRHNGDSQLDPVPHILDLCALIKTFHNGSGCQ
jgi:subtilisin family serine protease